MSHAARIHDADAAREAAQPDLFVRERIASLRAKVRDLEAARDLAAKKVRCAPHGSYRARMTAFGQATHALLIAEAALNRLLKETDRG